MSKLNTTAKYTVLALVLAALTLNPVGLCVLAALLAVLSLGGAIAGLYVAMPHVGRFFRFLARLLAAGFHAVTQGTPVVAKKAKPAVIALALVLALIVLVGTGLILLVVVALLVILAARSARRAAPPMRRALQATGTFTVGIVGGLVCVAGAVIGAVCLVVLAVLSTPLGLVLNPASPVS